MIDLTEQWKKGELPDGFYYFKMPDGAIEIASEYRLIRYNLTKDADKIEVLAPVPSYDHFVELTEKVKENKQLKELFKECRYMILAYSINHDTFTKEKVRDIVTKIDNAIGEKK